MIPSKPKRQSPKSERKLFFCLQDQLPKTWTVLHSVHFILPKSDEGEADFIILDPSRGFLVVEVKGGGINFEDGRWFSIDRTRKWNEITDPSNQATRAAHSISKLLHGHPNLKGNRIKFGWTVAFPDTEVNGPMGPGLPRELIFDRKNLRDLCFSLERAFQFHAIDEHVKDHRNLKQVFLDTLVTPCNAVISLKARVDDEAVDLIRLSDEQIRVLGVLETMRRVAIEGGAGTGKTFLAFEKSRRLVLEKKRTILLCFNRLLADYLTEQATGYDVNTFHGLCRDLVKRAGIPDPEGDWEKDPGFFEKEAPRRLLDALQSLPEVRYDAVIIDEAQDFYPDWFDAIGAGLFADPLRGVFYAFYDPNQVIFAGGTPKFPNVPTAKLQFNCRNTIEIANYSSTQIGQKSMVKDDSPLGDPVEEIEYNTEKECVDIVRKILHRLIIDNHIAYKRIVILTPRTVIESALFKVRQLGPVHLNCGESPLGPNEIQVVSIRRFKGLEADFIILCEVEPDSQNCSPTLLYVGTSRARHRLFVLKRSLSSR